MAGKKTSISEYEKLFREADKDKSGKLDEKEVRAVLLKGNSNLKESDFKTVFTFFDGENGDKLITLEEFTKGLQLIQDFIAQLHALFIECDRDGSGRLDKNELKALLSGADHEYTVTEINEIVKQADTNGDGQIGIEEFLAAVS